ncbi:hypothetical protein ZHAS_00010473 [Anopheles sinensis]|uniref:Uncharacterized protein n=1 Tax=Anopheles sinensis TaxID=74873 RepID=A0A084VXN7_ANOSI|nr:hypothetical protein ZHAS_00010473 [Anopheles sinensis]
MVTLRSEASLVSAFWSDNVSEQYTERPSVERQGSTIDPDLDHDDDDDDGLTNGAHAFYMTQQT